MVFIWTIGVCGIPVWLYVLGAYLGLSILNLRTFAEHQAHEAAGGRTVIVEASPVFGLLFLNNNLHYVHHENPRVPWYKLPALYRANRAAFLAANESYSFRGYSEMLRRYLFRRQDAGAASLPAARLMAVPDATPVASLPMYDWPEVHWANDVAMGGDRRPPARRMAFRRPPALDRSRTSDAVWRDPALVLSQTCGYPFATRLRGMVRLVGTPIYDALGCDGPYLFQHHRRPHRRARRVGLRSWPDGASPINSSDSLSGYRGVPAAAAERRGSIPAAVEWIETGSHRASVRAVAEEEADVAAIDSVCWALAASPRAEAVSRLRVARADAAPPRPALHHCGGAAGRREIEDNPVAQSKARSPIRSTREACAGALASTGARRISTSGDYGPIAELGLPDYLRIGVDQPLGLIAAHRADSATAARSPSR